ncbi:MAG: Arylsulfatase precursor, partial [Planctomycetota bacterium]
MKNRWISVCLPLWLFCCLPCGAAATEDTAAATNRPNVLLILSDDQAWTDYGFMGHPTIRTPHLDRLAASAALFRRGYTPTPLCRPSLMSILTGRYAHEHGIVGNDPRPDKSLSDQEYAALREQLISAVDRVPTLPRLLSSAGYACLQTGKWWEGNWKRGGFTEGMTRGFPEQGGRHG